MSLLPIALGALLGISGIAVLVRATARPLVDIDAVLGELDRTDVPVDELTERMEMPLLARLLQPVGTRAIGLVKSLLPSNYQERLRRKLIVAGLNERMTPEEFIAIQVVTLAGGVLFGLVLGLAAGWSSTGSVRSVVIFGALGGLVPTQILQKSREKRQVQIRKDLPDILDLLAISVEAGVGLEGAIEVVGQNFNTPLAHELGRMLREMELGVARRTALQNMKARIEVPDVSNFVLSLVQADALGMPIGRVLRAQAHEMRLKRRQWARERAGKLPVKIIFPLVMFILPALFVIVLGPAVMSISHQILHHGH